MKIRTAIFVVYVGVSALGLAAMMALVLRDVRLRYVESMRRTLGDTAAYMASFAAPISPEEDWTKKLAALPKSADTLRVFACDRAGRVIYDSAARDEGQLYQWPERGGGRAASENYQVSNVAVVDGELRVASRVMAGSEHLGWVGVGRPLAAAEEGVRRARWRLVILVGAIAGVMVVAGWWIAARLTRSLERLTAYARDVRDGRPVVLPPRSRAREIAQLGQAFEEMRDALEGRQHVERYTQAMAHEVKAPLAAIRGAAELLDEEMPDAQRRKFIANIRNESARIQQIVERLLELSSLEARKALRQTETISPAALVNEVASAMRPAFEAARVALVLKGVTPPDAGAGAGADVTEASGGAAAAGELRGERVLLREALVNLLQNALDFSAAGGEVTLRAETAGARVVFTVEDRGPGVPDYARERVFERFYSLPRPGSTRKSTGLGLALVREIAHLHGGEASLENRAEGGARAVITLPLA